MLSLKLFAAQNFKLTTSDDIISLVNAPVAPQSMFSSVWRLSASHSRDAQLRGKHRLEWLSYFEQSEKQALLMTENLDA